MDIEELQKYVDLFKDYDKEVLSEYDDRNFNLEFALEYLFLKNTYNHWFEGVERVENIGIDNNSLVNIDRMKVSDMEDDLKKIFDKDIKLENKEYIYEETDEFGNNDISKFEIKDGFIIRTGLEKIVNYYALPSNVTIEDVFDLGANYYLLNISSLEVDHDGVIYDEDPDLYSMILKKNENYYSLMKIAENQNIENIKDYKDKIDEEIRLKKEQEIKNQKELQEKEILKEEKQVSDVKNSKKSNSNNNFIIIVLGISLSLIFILVVTKKSINKK